jgi:hypothetical protein
MAIWAKIAISLVQYTPIREFDEMAISVLQSLLNILSFQQCYKRLISINIKRQSSMISLL